MASDRQGEDRDPNGPTPNQMDGHELGQVGTADEKRASGSQNQRNRRPTGEGQELVASSEEEHGMGKRGPHTAHDDQMVHNERLRGLADLGLDDTPLAAKAARLQQGTTHLDLSTDPNRTIPAMGGQEVTPGHRSVAKETMDYQLWNRATSVRDPERLGLASAEVLDNPDLKNWLRRPSFGGYMRAQTVAGAECAIARIDEALAPSSPSQRPGVRPGTRR